MNTYRVIDADYLLLTEGIDSTPDLTLAIDRLRRNGYRLGLAQLDTFQLGPQLTSLVPPLLLGARAVAIVEPPGRPGVPWHHQIRAALEVLHPSLPRLYSVVGAVGAPPSTLLDQLCQNLAWIVECMRTSGPDVLKLTWTSPRKSLATTGSPLTASQFRSIALPDPRRWLGAAPASRLICPA